MPRSRRKSDSSRRHTEDQPNLHLLIAVLPWAVWVVSHVLKATAGVQKRELTKTCSNHFLSILEKGVIIIRWRGCTADTFPRLSTQGKASVFLVQLDLQSPRFSSVKETGRSLSKGLNLGPLYPRMGLTGSGEKIIFKLCSLMHDYNSNILAFNFPILNKSQN